jgi:hypothetical protein
LGSKDQITVQGKERTVHIGCWRKFMTEVVFSLLVLFLTINLLLD